MAFLGIVYPNETVAAFSVYQFWGVCDQLFTKPPVSLCLLQSIGNTVAYLYSTVLLLPYQLLLLVIMTVPAAFGFFREEWKVRLEVDAYGKHDH